jgi:hypothetical protein
MAGGAKSQTNTELLKQKLADIEGVESVSIAPGLDAITVALKGSLPDVLK